MNKSKIMYYPKQIPYLLDREFQENVEYIEHTIKELENYCMCIWTMKSKKILNKTISNNILPDACIDLVIDFSNHTICFAGFSKETENFQLNKQIDYMGVRLKPSIFYLLYNIEADKIMDHEIPFCDIEKKINLEDILTLKNTNERITYLTNYLLQKAKGKKEMLFMEVVDELYKNPKEQTVMDISKKFGYNERHLYRIFKTNYGVSPKVLLNILRLHLCLTLILEKNMDLIDIALFCGFYDQSHFIREIKKYTGISPLKIIEDYQ
ncbi:MAG: helix-turn-helix transcriptional regulator [Clostridia bacterium]|nr:helix-turn-helix transcriptional regulator [Clostridia bacterium]